MITHQNVVSNTAAFLKTLEVSESVIRFLILEVKEAEGGKKEKQSKALSNGIVFVFRTIHFKSQSFTGSL
jgi:ribosomal protein S6